MIDINKVDLRAQVASLMSILAMNEQDQRAALDLWGAPAQNKDDLAENLHRIINI